MDLTWSLDYCLACDRQVTTGGAYCSQSCRVADLETSSNWSGSTSPATVAASPSWQPPDSHRGSGFYLAPAINFSMYTNPASSTAYSTTHGTPPPSSAAYSSNPRDATDRILTPSSSNSSLKSTSGDTASPSGLSPQAHHELVAYTNSLDTTRRWKRRATWS